MSFIGKLNNLFDNKNTTAPSSDGDHSAPASLKKKVLVVEDEVLLANALEAKLKQAGFEVFKAANGQIGLEMAISNKPNVILLDLLMPVMDGKTMLRRLRDVPEFKHLPVIILTNAGDSDNIRETKFYYNASDFVIKSNSSIDDIVQKASCLI